MRKKIILTPRHRTTHSYVIGQSGTGKSRALESMIMQDIVEGHGVGVIDPHGDLYNNIVLRLALYPEVWDRIVLINPFDARWSVGINPLEPVKGLPLERTSAFMTDVMMKIWRLDPTNAPRMLFLVANTFLALSDLGLSLLDLPKFLRNTKYRNNLLPHITKPRVVEYFSDEFPKDQEEINHWTSPALNKIGALVFDPDIRPMLAGGSTLNMRDILDGQKVLLVNLSKGLLGESASSLLGAFIVARLQSVALSRADTNRRPQFYLYLDEFQNYTTDNIKDILTESRKYGLSITFAHQYLKQIPDDIQSAVINTAGSIFSFRVGYQDATVLAREIFPSSRFMEKATHSLRMKPDGVFPKLSIEEKNETASWDNQAQKLASLKQREFWVKRRGVLEPSKHRSITMPDVEETSNLKFRISRMVEISGKKYARSKLLIRKQIGDDPSGRKSLEGYTDEVSNYDGDIPLWDS